MTDTPFEHALTGEIIPYVDANFRTLADQSHRALAGLSMGGALTHGISLAHLDKFAYVGVYSSGVLGGADAFSTPGAAGSGNGCTALRRVPWTGQYSSSEKVRSHWGQFIRPLIDQVQEVEVTAIPRRANAAVNRARPSPFGTPENATPLGLTEASSGIEACSNPS